MTDYGHCPTCNFAGELEGSCVVNTEVHPVSYREKWVCAREDPLSPGYIIGMGCGRIWWEMFVRSGQMTQARHSNGSDES